MCWLLIQRTAMHSLIWQQQNERLRALLPQSLDLRPHGLLWVMPPRMQKNSRASHSSSVSASSTVHDVPTSFAAGRYEVKKFLGEGGKKRVYLAHDSRLDRDVAFALIKSEGLDQASRERVGREAQAMGRLGAHPHIVTVFDIGERTFPTWSQSSWAAAMWKDSSRVRRSTACPWSKALRIAAQVCAGLEFAHGHGIVHRDLKPGNVWLTEDPSTSPSTSSGHGSGHGSRTGGRQDR